MRPARTPANPGTVRVANRFRELEVEDDDDGAAVNCSGNQPENQAVATSKAPRWIKSTPKTTGNRNGNEADYLDSVDVNRPQ